MSEEINLKRAIEQLLELDTFFTDDLAVKGPHFNISIEKSVAAETTSSAQPKGTLAQAVHKVNTKTSPQQPITNVAQYVPAKNQTLESLAKQIKTCQACELGKTRQHPVPGEGNPTAQIIFVSESPDGDEDMTGRPLVGRAGQMLTKIINAMGLERDQVYLCNTLKCRPPENNRPKTGEEEACRHFLREQIRMINPKVIVALGSNAAKELLQTDEPIGKLRGKFREYKPTPDSQAIMLMPTYHPAYLLKNYSPDNRKKVWEDMQAVMELLGLEAPKKQKN